VPACSLRYSVNMRYIAGVLGLWLASLLSCSGCASTTRPLPPDTETRALNAAAAGAANQAAPAAAGAPRLVFEISARYPASLAYALDRVAVARGGSDLRYRQWLFGADAVTLPDWFTAYATRRASWRATRDSGNGPYEPYSVCSHCAETQAALLECAQQLLEPSDFALARTAWEQADTLLHPRWLALEPVMLQWQRELQAITSGPQGRELAQLLARSAQLPDDEQLQFQVVLVAKPRSDESRANQAGGYLVMEVSDERPAISEAHVLFHEIAHLAARHAPGRPALERAFVGHGSAGVVAAGLWSEAFATAFGNGMAAERLAPGFTPERSFYQDEAIDALGHALYRHWRAGGKVTLDASLGKLLLQLLDSAWPRERWRLSDVMSRVVAFSEDRESGALLRAGLRAQSMYLSSPVPPELSLPESLSPPAPRLILATLHTLRERPDVLRLLHLELASASAQVSASGPSLYWVDDDSGPALLLTGATTESLQAATRAFVGLQRLPPPGWTSLATKAAGL
jgi:hypothetical protein